MYHGCRFIGGLIFGSNINRRKDFYIHHKYWCTSKSLCCIHILTFEFNNITWYFHSTFVATFDFCILNAHYILHKVDYFWSKFTFTDMLHLLSMEIKIERVQWRLFLICPYRLCYRVLMSSYSHAGCVRANKSHSTRRRTCSLCQEQLQLWEALPLICNGPNNVQRCFQIYPLGRFSLFVSVGFQNFNRSSYFLPFVFLQILENLRISSFGGASGDSSHFSTFNCAFFVIIFLVFD
jgi:hypothetical protein